MWTDHFLQFPNESTWLSVKPQTVNSDWAIMVAGFNPADSGGPFYVNVRLRDMALLESLQPYAVADNESGYEFMNTENEGE